MSELKTELEAQLEYLRRQGINTTEDELIALEKKHFDEFVNEASRMVDMLTSSKELSQRTNMECLIISLFLTTTYAESLLCKASELETKHDTTIADITLLKKHSIKLLEDLLHKHCFFKAQNALINKQIKH